MTTQILVKNLSEQIDNLQKDVRAIKEFIFSHPSDPEGEYKLEFIAKTLDRSKEDAQFKFTDKKSFLRHVRSWE